METFLVFLALMVACITLFIQRQHNRKELLPILSTEYEQTNRGGEELYQLWLVNNGHGVAIINNIHLNLPNGDVIELSDSYSFLNVIAERVQRNTQMSNSIPRSLGASNRELLYSFTIPASATNGMFGTSVTIVAESVYGDKITVNREGFDVLSNSRDAAVEGLLKLVFDKVLSILPKRN